MKKIGITTIASLGVNVILSLWLVNQYFYDQYFHSYVDAALGPVYPFIVLTAGLGGGSSLGYLLLKRRHAGDGTGIERTKLFKSSGPVQSSASQGKILPTGPPPGQVSRHTAYAVPPLPRSSSSSGASRGPAPSSISALSKPASAPSPSTAQRLEQLTQPSTSVLNSTLRDQVRPEPAPRSFPPSPPPMVSRGESPPPPINRIPPDSSKTGFPQQWKPEPSPAPERGFDSTVFPRPGQMESKTGGESSPYGSPLGQAPKPPQASQTPFPVSKWAPPDQKGETQWTDPVPKPGLAAPQKWAPPPGQGFGPRPPQGGPPRPGAGPVPGPTGQRPPYPPGQAPLPPRPLGFPAPGRPGQPAPIGVPPPFRSDQPRPPGPPPQGRPMSPPGGSMPQPWSPQKTSDKPEQESQAKEFGSPSSRPPQFGSSENLRSSAEKAPEPSGSGGEMDWDTALDTILKTLKKDRGVGEKT